LAGQGNERICNNRTVMLRRTQPNSNRWNPFAKPLARAFGDRASGTCLRTGQVPLRQAFCTNLKPQGEGRPASPPGVHTTYSAIHIPPKPTGMMVSIQNEN
jgi:hypothetical protein